MTTIKEFIRERTFFNTEELLKAYGELIVDKCAEEVKTKPTCSIWNCEGESINKESILNVKKLLV